ncbi:glycosyltransferase [Flavivirga aquimarina]|uniref:Glycosyltransferase n=1 Tax=Flavivirga aquimarina TaxID=2027862 RepID=A0ABT8W8N5_9FLAO|nr:glycosyltransferase [Flavivirga aquimarina]MDO5969490.1 glycosyltransferase [Flavivirga aquimarina]
MYKILFILMPVEGYGAEKSLLSNIIYLKNQNLIDPLIIINKKSPSLELLLQKENIRFFKIPFNCFIKASTKGVIGSIKPHVKYIVNKILAMVFSSYLQFFNKSKIDFVYTNTLTSFYGLFLSRKLKVKHILHIREVIGEQFDFTLDFGTEKTYNKLKKNTSLFICNSEYTKNYYSKYFNTNSLKVVPNPIRLDEFTNEKKAKREKIKLICLGRYYEDKNQMELLKAVKLLSERGVTDFKLDLFGDGILESTFLQFIETNNLKDLISINGYTSDISSLLAKYDIAIVPSRFEAFGRVTIEYILSGLAVIGNDSGNTKYLINHQESGLIYKYGNEMDLSEKIELLLDNKELRHNLAKNAKIQIGNTFSVKNSSEELYKALKSLK